MEDLEQKVKQDYIKVVNKICSLENELNDLNEERKMLFNKFIELQRNKKRR